MSPSSPGFGRRGPRSPGGRRSASAGIPAADPAAAEAQGVEPAERLGSVLDDLLSTRPWRRGLALGKLARRWPEVVGERLAAESAPIALDDGVMVIAVSSAAWAAQVRFLAEEIRGRAETVVRTGEIGSIRVVVRGGS